MGKTQKKLFLWAGIISFVFALGSILMFVLLNFVFKATFNEMLNYMENDLGLKNSFGNFRTYMNSAMICSFLVNLFLGFKYVSYSRMNIRRLAQKSGGMLFILLINVFCGGSLISLILAVIAMSKPITPEFNDSSIKEIDRELLEQNPSTVSQILKIKQDKLNGLITDEEYKIKLNKVLEDEARRYL